MKLDTPKITHNTRMCFEPRVRSASTRRTAVAFREMRTSVLSPGLCLLLIAFFSMPVEAKAATAYETKELFKLYTHTQLLSAKQYYCVEKLWDLESRWSPTARNSKSSAYGIPQLLKLTETNPFKQIDRGLAYIKHRYGTPCAAYLHHKKVGHY